MGLPLSLARPLDATPAGTGVDCWATIKKDQEAQFECHPHIVGPTAKANGREGQEGPMYNPLMRSLALFASTDNLLFQEQPTH